MSLNAVSKHVRALERAGLLLRSRRRRARAAAKVEDEGPAEREPGDRGMDLLSPVWHFLDLLPQGRGDFWPARAY